MRRKPPRESSRPKVKRVRKQRSRPTPRWLSAASDLDEMARRRCLMILNVLSGAQPVTEAIEEGKLSRGTYYQLETKALKAMLAALMPGAEASGEGDGSRQRISQLEDKVKRLEQDKRRTERLLFLTRQVLKPGTMVTGSGRPAKRQTDRSSMKTGKSSSRRSRKTPAPAPTSIIPSPSTPSSAGGTGPSTGSAS